MTGSGTLISSNLSWSNRYVNPIYCLTNYISLSYVFSNFTDYGDSLLTILNPQSNHFCVAQPFFEYHIYSKKLGSCLELTILTGNPPCLTGKFPIWSVWKNMLARLNYISYGPVTSPENFSFKKVFLALDWPHQELVTMMHDLIHTLVLMSVVFQYLKIVLRYPFFVMPQASRYWQKCHFINREV